MMARLVLSLLGPLHVTLDGQPVASFGYDKVRALLAYLSVEADRSHHRAALAELFWPDQPAAAARKSLRVALSILRQAIGDATAHPPFLLISRDTIQLNPAGDYTLDVTVFTNLIAVMRQHILPDGVLCDGCASQLARAVALYRDEFLHQISVRDSVAFEEWVLLVRERLHRGVLDALAHLAAYHERRNEDDLARQYAWKALALEPWDEAAHCSLMRVFARRGQRSAALAQYERCRRVLAQDLGLDPAPETTALYNRIRAGVLERSFGAL